MRSLDILHNLLYYRPQMSSNIRVSCGLNTMNRLHHHCTGCHIFLGQRSTASTCAAPSTFSGLISLTRSSASRIRVPIYRCVNCFWKVWLVISNPVFTNVVMYLASPNGCRQNFFRQLMVVLGTDSIECKAHIGHNPSCSQENTSTFFCALQTINWSGKSWYVVNKSRKMRTRSSSQILSGALKLQICLTAN